ncbi:uncharacterized protein IWZ02DRAFT_499902 [Phyllosticta citriasiana]|uniref:uncharacterized protein n=1 Tax=Phyllosticta citriasiana TaxID=595635 RepID=UPI0030FD99E1
MEYYDDLEHDIEENAPLYYDAFYDEVRAKAQKVRTSFRRHWDAIRGKLRQIRIQNLTRSPTVALVIQALSEYRRMREMYALAEVQFVEAQYALFIVSGLGDLPNSPVELQYEKNIAIRERYKKGQWAAQVCDRLAARSNAHADQLMAIEFAAEPPSPRPYFLTDLPAFQQYRHAFRATASSSGPPSSMKEGEYQFQPADLLGPWKSPSPDTEAFSATPSMRGAEHSSPAASQGTRQTTPAIRQQVTVQTLCDMYAKAQDDEIKPVARSQSKQPKRPLQPPQHEELGEFEAFEQLEQPIKSKPPTAQKQPKQPENCKQPEQPKLPKQPKEPDEPGEVVQQAQSDQSKLSTQPDQLKSPKESPKRSPKQSPKRKLPESDESRESAQPEQPENPEYPGEPEQQEQPKPPKRAKISEEPEESVELVQPEQPVQPVDSPRPIRSKRSKTPTKPQVDQVQNNLYF